MPNIPVLTTLLGALLFAIATYAIVAAPGLLDDTATPVSAVKETAQ